MQVFLNISCFKFELRDKSNYVLTFEMKDTVVKYEAFRNQREMDVQLSVGRLIIQEDNEAN